MATKKARTVAGRKPRPGRVLREVYQNARDAEVLILDPKTPSEVRAQLEQACLEAAEAMGITVFHPALIRQAFIEILQQSSENFRLGIKTTTHHFECPVIRLLTIVDYGAQGVGPINLEEEIQATNEISIACGRKPDGMEDHSRRALGAFIARATCREACSNVPDGSSGCRRR